MTKVIKVLYRAVRKPKLIRRLEWKAAVEGRSRSSDVSLLMGASGQCSTALTLSFGFRA
jgi:hypothetical protein